jgi:hypothetical protein
MLKAIPTLFLGLNSTDMRQLLNRQPIVMPTHIEIPEPRVEFQILMFGAETDDALREQFDQLTDAVFLADEEKRN